MTFLELQNALLRRLRDQSGGMTTVAQESINWALMDLAERFDWYWWLRRGYFSTVASYSTGTVTTTADSLSVTGASTVWSYRMIGRKIEFGATSVGGAATSWYTIRKVPSATSIVLDHPFRGTAGAAQSYVIYQDEYALRWDMDRINMIRYLEGPFRVVRFYQDELYYTQPNPRRTGKPELYRPRGVSPFPYYDVGTVSVSNTATVKLSGAGGSADAAFIGKAFRTSGSSRIYEIVSVPSASRIKLDVAYADGRATGKKYEVDPVGTPVLQLYPIPVDKFYLTYEYQKIPQLLYAATDQAEVPQKWHEVLLLGAVWRALQQREDVPETILQAAETDYSRYVERMQRKDTQEDDKTMQYQTFDNRIFRPRGTQPPYNYPWRFAGY